MSRKPTYEELEQRILELGNETSRRERAEESLRVALTKYKTLFDAFPLGITLSDEAGKILEANSIAEELLGVPLDEHTQRDIDSPQWRIVRPDGTPMPTEEYASVRALKEKRRVENVQMGIVKPGGEVTWINVSAAPLQLEGHGVVIAYGDISERKRTEEALRQTEAKYQTLVDQSVQGLVVIEGWRIVFANPALADISGYPVEEMKSLSSEQVMALIHPEDQALVWGHFRDRLAGKAVTPRYEYRGVRKDGTVRWLEMAASRIAYGGKPAIQGTIIDLTERKRAEAALRDANLVVEKSPVVIFRWKATAGWPVDMVSQNVGQFGYTPEELLSGAVPYASMVYLEDLDRVAREVQEHSASGAAQFQQEYRIVTKDGRVRWVDDRTSVERNIDGEIVFYQGVLIDITERKEAEEEKDRLEAQLKQAQKMEAIGTLAGGIAHDFNNILMGIQGRASLVLLDMDPSNPHFEHLRGIEEHVKSAADLTKQLLGFARGGKYEVKATDLNELADQHARLFGRTRKEIAIHRKFQQGLWTVEVDRRQIEQVLLNLFVNAWQAMPAGGEIYFQTENVVLDEAYVRPHGVNAGQYVKISVTDNGVGIDEQTKQRLFDPFFTTKEMGRGTGLGLASAYGIIKNHEGIITVYSEKSHGSTFNLYLPASGKEISDEKKALGDLVKGEGTLLLVDDEEMILKVGTPMLEKIGYKVLVARSGKEAIQVYQKNRDLIKAVILDMIMPQMSGGETFDQMRATNPRVKVLLSSGYSINGEAQEILNRGCHGFIQKPFNLRELSQRLGEILRRP